LKNAYLFKMCCVHLCWLGTAKFCFNFLDPLSILEKEPIGPLCFGCCTL
jgi:hypothetical protein